MKKLIAAFTLALCFGSSAQAATYIIDPVHTEVSFKVSHLGLSNVRGEFSDFSGTIEFDPNDIAASNANATIRTSSIDTSNDKRDEHLRSADFFDSANKPVMTFTSTEVKDVKGKNFKVVGDLTLNGITKPVVLDVEHTGNIIDANGNQRAGFHATTTINRKEFGLGWNKILEAGGVVVGDEVAIDISLQGIKEK